MNEPTELSPDTTQPEVASIENHAEAVALHVLRRWIWVPLLLVVLWIFNNDGDVDALRERFDFVSLIGGWMLGGAAIIAVLVWALCKILDKVPMPFDDESSN